MRNENGEQCEVREGRAVNGTIFSTCVFAAGIMAMAYFFDGKTGLEKTLIRMSFPIGLVWLALTAWLFHAVWQRRWRLTVAVVCVWLLFTSLGSTPVSNIFLRMLENQFTNFRPGVDPNLDIVVVLGGGTLQGPERAQAGMSGDRVVYAAQLLTAGYTQKLVTTGDTTAGFGRARKSAREQTIEIWQKLGIDPSQIGQLNGINTYQEIQSIKQLQQELPGQRIGLLTSAYHLPRALRLARSAGMHDLVPVAADYQVTVESFSFVDLIPSAHAFDQVARCQHEFMAAIVGR